MCVRPGLPSACRRREATLVKKAVAFSVGTWGPAWTRGAKRITRQQNKQRLPGKARADAAKLMAGFKCEGYLTSYANVTGKPALDKLMVAIGCDQHCLAAAAIQKRQGAAALSKTCRILDNS